MATIALKVILEISGRRNIDQYNITRNVDHSQQSEQKEDTDERLIDRHDLIDDKIQTEGNDGYRICGLDKADKVHKTNRQDEKKAHKATRTYKLIGRGQQKFISRFLTVCLLTCLFNSLGEAAQPFDADGLDLLVSYMALRHGARPWYGPDRTDCTQVPPIHLHLVIRHGRQSVDDEQAVSMNQENDNFEISLRFLSGNQADQTMRSQASNMEIAGRIHSNSSGCYGGREVNDQQIDQQITQTQVVENTTVLEISDSTYTSGSNANELNEYLFSNPSDVELTDSSRLVDTRTSLPDVVAEISDPTYSSGSDVVELNEYLYENPRYAEEIQSSQLENISTSVPDVVAEISANGNIRKGENGEREDNDEERRNNQENPCFEEANDDVSLRNQRKNANNGGPSQDYEEELSSDDNKDKEDLCMAIGPEVALPRNRRDLHDQQRTRQGHIEATIAQATSSDTGTLQYENDMVQRLIDEKDLVLEDGQDQVDQQKRKRFRRTRKKTKQRGKKKNES